MTRTAPPTSTTTEPYYDSDEYYKQEEPEFVFPVSRPQEDNSRIRFEDDQDDASFEPAVKRISGYNRRRRKSRKRSLQARGCGAGKKYCENSRQYPTSLVNQIVASESKIPYKIKNKLIKVRKELLFSNRNFRDMYCKILW